MGDQNGLARPPAQACRLAGGPAQTWPEAGATPQPEASGPALISPANGATYRISAGVPAERQQIAIQAIGGGTNSPLSIVIDGEPVAELSGPPYRAFWRLAPGEHRAWVEAGGARSAEVRFTVIK